MNKQKFLSWKGLLAIAMPALFFSSCNRPAKPDAAVLPEAAIHVGVFSGHGGAETCKWETFEAVRVDKQMRVRFIGSSDIAALPDSLTPSSCLVAGSTQYLTRARRYGTDQDVIRNGGGAVGICAGAYLFSNTPDYACMRIRRRRPGATTAATGVSKFT